MISAIILTKNEEKNIVDCIQSVEWCDEIIVIDDYSIDKTIDIIEKSQNRKVDVYKHHLNNDFSFQRNFALEKAKYEWVLFVDADERISNSLEFEILNMINATVENFQGFYIKRRDILWRKELRFGETGNSKLLRLGKKDSGKWIGLVHEEWKIGGKIGELRNPLMHYPHQKFYEFLNEVNYYTDIRAKELVDKKVKVSLWQIIIYPSAKFLQNYVFRLGFLDGLRGLIVAVMMSLHSFLVRGKIWQRR